MQNLTSDFSNAIISGKILLNSSSCFKMQNDLPFPLTDRESHLILKALQSGLEYRTFKFRIHSNSERFKIQISNGSVFEPPFENRTIQNGRYSLGHFICKIFLLYIVNWPRLKRPFWMFWFRMVGTIRKPNTIQNGRFSLGHFTIYSKNILHIKLSRLTIVRFSNGGD